MDILAISGSLRQRSGNSAVLARASLLARGTTRVRSWDGLAALPAFDPDRDDDPPVTVRRFRAAVSAASAVLISSPEYAHGVAGALKNALDWLVGSGELYGKPVTLLNISSRATHAQAALAETLRTMGAAPLLDVTIPATYESCAAGDVDGPLAALVEQIERAVTV